MSDSREVDKFRLADETGVDGARIAVVVRVPPLFTQISPNAIHDASMASAPRAAGRPNGVRRSSFVDRTIPLPSVSEPRCYCLRNHLLPMLPVAIIPWSPPALITTVSISKPLSTTTKFAATGGRPSVKLIVKVPVQSEFTV